MEYIAISLHETEFKNCLGIISNKDSISFDKYFYEKLIEKKFFIKETNNAFIKEIRNANDNTFKELDCSNKDFELIAIIDNIRYELNPKIYNYIFIDIENTIKLINDDDLIFFREEINFKLKYIYEYSNRESFINDEINKITNCIDNIIDYNNYNNYNKTGLMNFGSWKEYIIYTLSYENEIILDYLKGRCINVSKFTVWDSWKVNYLIKSKLDFLKEKYYLYGTCNNPLFKGYGEAFLKYISLKSEMKINSAFFTYLFFFLKDEKLINSISTTNDTLYIAYILNNKYLSKFSRFTEMNTNTENSKYFIMMDYFKGQHSEFLKIFE